MADESNVTIHLIKLLPTVTPASLIEHTEVSSVLLKGIPYGWVHEPHQETKSELLGSTWDLFLVTEPQVDRPTLQDFIEAHIEIPVMITAAQYRGLKEQSNTLPQPSPETPPLPHDWTSPSLHIPPKSLVPSKQSPLHVGELRLDSKMSHFLSTTLPPPFRNSPVCFFNLFKYKNGDPTIHNNYMQGFKDNFGNTAGASIKFMGACLAFGDWIDANLVQYDSVWHYAYMLSTEVYKELNRVKVAGLEDTCILMVGEMELLSAGN